MNLQKGDIVKFTSKSKNHGMIAEITGFRQGGALTVRSNSPLVMANGGTAHEAVVSDQSMITLVRQPEPDNVVNIFEAKKHIAKKSGDTASYNFNEVMKKNQMKEERMRKERGDSNKSVTRSHRLK